MAWLNGSKGQTPGKAMTGIRLVRDADGSTLGGPVGPARWILLRDKAVGASVLSGYPRARFGRATFLPSPRSRQEACVDVLPDLLDHGLRLVVVGTAVGECSARRGHYYAGPGQSFWSLLSGAGLTPRVLRPEEDAALLETGIGLTDLVRDVSRSPRRGPAFDVPALATKITRHRPGWVAFNGKAAASACARWAGQPPPGLGLQEWTFAGAAVFVLPSSSGANRRRDYDGRPDRASWWDELGARVAQD